MSHEIADRLTPMKRRSLPKAALWLWAAMMLCASMVFAQEYRGTISGMVTDPSGAAVPGAQIEIVNQDTSFLSPAKTNEIGTYTVPFLVPGTYTVRAKATGFKDSVKTGVVLHASDKLEINLPLAVGSSTDAITVSAEGEMLQTASAQMGQVIGDVQVKELPNIGRNPFMLSSLSAGVYTGMAVAKQSAYTQPYSGAAAQMAINGIGGAYQILLNGIPNDPPERNSGTIYIGFVPSPDAVAEVNTQTNLYDAQYGHSAGAVVNSVLKNGSEKFHGSAYFFLQNTALNANLWENKHDPAALKPRPIDKWLQPGFMLSGPLSIPKVYDGKQKTFFMFSWERIAATTPKTWQFLVPTADERAGNFGSTAIYDPLNLDANGNRLQFANNSIPDNRIDPVAKALLAYIPLPNVTSNGAYNYLSNGSDKDRYYSIVARIDHQISDKDKVNGAYFQSIRNQTFNDADFPQQVGGPGYVHFRNNFGGTIDWTHVFSPTLVWDTRAGAIYHPFQVGYYGTQSDLASLGLSSALISQLPSSAFPGVSFSNGYVGRSPGVGGTTNLLSGAAASTQYSETTASSFSSILSKSVNKHTIKFGYELYDLRANMSMPLSGLGTFSFDTGFTQQAYNNASGGSPVASFLLGMPSGGNVINNFAPAYRQLYQGVFIHDDWKVNARLTLNIGLRWDYESPMTERHNRQNAGFCFSCTNPLQASIATDWKKTLNLPANIQAIIPSTWGLTGGLLFTDSVNRLPFKRDLNNWQPRIGAAYKLTEKAVLRGGFGIMYYPTTSTGGSNGFRLDTSMASSNSLDGGKTPAAYLNNPFPSGILPVTGSSQGLATYLGQGFTFNDPNRTLPKLYQYSLGLEYQLPSNILVDINYAGNASRGLPVSKGINELPSSYFSLGSSILDQKVNNPLSGLLPSGQKGATITVANLLRPYPEFSGITEASVPIGKQSYNSLQLAITKRASHGLQFVGSFTLAKIMNQNGYLNSQDSWDQLVRSEDSQPNRMFRFSPTYELPFFRNARGLKGVLGGWSTSLTFQVSNGLLVSTPGGAIATGVSPKIDNPSLGHWFNTCYVDLNGKKQNCASDQEAAWIQMPSYTLRTLNWNIDGVRTHIVPRADLSIVKKFTLHERFNTQLRGEFFNLTNTPQFGGPNTGLTDKNFGKVTLAQQNDPRIIQISLRVAF